MLKDERGFSLVQVMVAAGLVGVISLGVNQLIGNMNKSVVTAESKGEELSLKTTISTFLKSSSACRETLVGKNIGDNIDAIKNSAGTEVIKVYSSSLDNKYGNRSVKINSMKLVDRAEPEADGTRMIDFEVELERVKKQVRGSRVRVLRIPIRVEAASATDVINSCFTASDGLVVLAMEESCNMLGGTWDATDKKCDLGSTVDPVTGPDDSCPPGKVILSQYRKYNCVLAAPSCGNPRCRVYSSSRRRNLSGHDPGVYWEDTRKPGLQETWNYNYQEVQGDLDTHSGGTCYCYANVTCTGSNEYKTYCFGG